MFSKKAVILTNSIGAPNKQAQKDVSTSLTWLGVSDIKTLGIGLMEGVIWEELSAKKREDIILKVNRLANKYNKTFVPARKSMKIKILFNINRMLHSRILKGEVTPSADNLHWINKGWIKQ